MNELKEIRKKIYLIFLKEKLYLNCRAKRNYATEVWKKYIFCHCNANWSAWRKTEFAIVSSVWWVGCSSKSFALICLWERKMWVDFLSFEVRRWACCEIWTMHLNHQKRCKVFNVSIFELQLQKQGAMDFLGGFHALKRKMNVDSVQSNRICLVSVCIDWAYVNISSAIGFHGKHFFRRQDVS